MVNGFNSIHEVVHRCTLYCITTLMLSVDVSQFVFVGVVDYRMTSAIWC